MEKQIDPLSISNYNISLMRTTLSMTSLSVAVIGMGSIFNDNEMMLFSYIVKALGGFLFIISSLYGFQCTYNFMEFTKKASKLSLSPVLKNEVKSMKIYVFYHYIYLALLVIVACLFMYMRVNISFVKYS